jgi:hypothetical protein
MPLPLLAAVDLALCLAPTTDLQHTFVEHEDLKVIVLAGQNHFNIQSVCDVRAGKGPALLRSHFPVFTAAIGSRDPQAPAVGFFGGIHGLERIGTQVILHYRKNWAQTLMALP